MDTFDGSDSHRPGRPDWGSACSWKRRSLRTEAQETNLQDRGKEGRAHRGNWGTVLTEWCHETQGRDSVCVGGCHILPSAATRSYFSKDDVRAAPAESPGALGWARPSASGAAGGFVVGEVLGKLLQWSLYLVRFWLSLQLKGRIGLMEVLEMCYRLDHIYRLQGRIGKDRVVGNFFFKILFIYF